MDMNPVIEHRVDRRFCVAPMMDWTDRHDRFFLRLMSRRALLYTEMVTAQAVIHGDLKRLLGFSPEEHPIALQLGGADPAAMAEAAAIGARWGYDEINMNVGCPSDRVQSGRFGACLMAEPATVGACAAAMISATSMPVTVKCRIGVDDCDSEDDLHRFIDTVAAAGCTTIIVHARKALLKGLSPKQNREIPPLRYDVVQRVKARYPSLEIVLNGGIPDLDAAAEHLQRFDGVMLGRAVYHNPYLLAEVDRRFFGDDTTAPDRWQVAEAMAAYAEQACARGTRLAAIARHMHGLFHGLPGARAWRSHLSEACAAGAGPDGIRAALRLVPRPGEAAAA